MGFDGVQPLPQAGQFRGSWTCVGPLTVSGSWGVTAGVAALVARESLAFTGWVGDSVLVSGAAPCVSQAVVAATVAAMRMAWRSEAGIFMGGIPK